MTRKLVSVVALVTIADEAESRPGFRVNAHVKSHLGAGFDG